MEVFGTSVTLNLNPCIDLRAKRILDGERVVDHLAVLQVFGVKHRATRFERRSHDQRVVERKPVALGYLQSPLVNLNGQRDHMADGGDRVERLPDFGHVHAKLAQSH